VVYALLADGWRVTLAARRFEQARQLAASFADRGLRILERLQDADLPGTALVVNATPIGMFPKPDESPWPADLPFPDAAIYDLVYNPPETKLVKAARAAGLPAATGLGMLVEQAALAFEIWTGRRPPREALFRAVVRSVPA
jgi:shikimate dehydrogenase